MMTKLLWFVHLFFIFNDEFLLYLNYVIFFKNFKSLFNMFWVNNNKNEYGISRCYPSFVEGKIIS
jgi:hypothetical protein